MDYSHFTATALGDDQNFSHLFGSTYSHTHSGFSSAFSDADLASTLFGDTQPPTALDTSTTSTFDDSTIKPRKKQQSSLSSSSYSLSSALDVSSPVSSPSSLPASITNNTATSPMPISKSYSLAHALDFDLDASQKDASTQPTVFDLDFGFGISSSSPFVQHLALPSDEEAPLFGSAPASFSHTLPTSSATSTTSLYAQHPFYAAAYHAQFPPATPLPHPHHALLHPSFRHAHIQHRALQAPVQGVVDPRSIGGFSELYSALDESLTTDKNPQQDGENNASDEDMDMDYSYSYEFGSGEGYSTPESSLPPTPSTVASSLPSVSALHGHLGGSSPSPSPSPRVRSRRMTMGAVGMTIPGQLARRTRSESKVRRAAVRIRSSGGRRGSASGGDRVPLAVVGRRLSSTSVTSTSSSSYPNNQSQQTSIPIQIPIPNFTKKSRGRRVPTLELASFSSPASGSSGSASNLSTMHFANANVAAASMPVHSSTMEQTVSFDNNTSTVSSSLPSSSTLAPEQLESDAQAHTVAEPSSPPQEPTTSLSMLLNMGVSLGKSAVGIGHGKNARMYVCQVAGCGKCFQRGEHLKRHVRSIHTNEKPHKCPFPGCGKEFSRHDNLHQHTRVHRNFAAVVRAASNNANAAAAAGASTTAAVSSAPTQGQSFVGYNGMSVSTRSSAAATNAPPFMVPSSVSMI